MKAIPFIFGVVLLYPLAASATEIQPIAVFGKPVADRQLGWNGHVDYVCWENDQIVCGGRSGFIRCFDMRSKRQKWSVNIGGKISDISVAASINQIYALDEMGNVSTLQLADGRLITKLSRDRIAKFLAKRFVIPNRLLWIPGTGRLLVLTHAESYAENGFLLDPVSHKCIAAMKSDGFVSKVTTDLSGRFIVTHAYQNNIRIWDTTIGREVFSVGKDDDITDLATDAPFVSNASFDGNRTLVYSVDNSWATGKVIVHDIVKNEEIARFDSRNGHAELAVDFQRGRIALTGTSQGLTLLDLSGKALADQPKITLQRNVAIAFSGDGTQLAIGSWDNTVRVFKLHE